MHYIYTYVYICKNIYTLYSYLYLYLFLSILSFAMSLYLLEIFSTLCQVGKNDEKDV